MLCRADYGQPVKPCLQARARNSFSPGREPRIVLLMRFPQHFRTMCGISTFAGTRSAATTAFQVIVVNAIVVTWLTDWSLEHSGRSGMAA